MEAARRLASYDDLQALPDDVRAEVIAGEVIASPSPLPRRAKVQRALGSYLGKPFEDDDGRGDPGGWWILPEIDVRLGPHDIVRPDLSGFRRERLPAPWDTRPIDVIPDWICEIVSPSNAAYDRVVKRNLYAERGVSHYWIVDPLERTLDALRLQGERWVVIGGYTDGAIARIEPFDAIELEIERLFPPRT